MKVEDSSLEIPMWGLALTFLKKGLQEFRVYRQIENPC